MARNDNGRSFTMMKTAGKYARKILSIALICILALSFSVQAFAAGEETWGYTTQLVPVGYFNFKNTNLTPVKTIDYTGLLTIDISFFQRTDSSSSPVKLTVQVRKAGTSTVLAEDVFTRLLEMVALSLCKYKREIEFKSSLMLVLLRDIPNRDILALHV